MPLPTNSDIYTMKFSFIGEPSVQVTAKSSLNPGLLSYSFIGEPFVPYGTGGSGPVVVPGSLFFCHG